MVRLRNACLHRLILFARIGFVLTLLIIVSKARAVEVYSPASGYGQVPPCSQFKSELNISTELYAASKWGLVPDPNFVLDTPDNYRTQCQGLECCGIRGNINEVIGLGNWMKKSVRSFLAYRNVYASLMNGTIHSYNEWQEQQLDTSEYFQCCARLDSDAGASCAKKWPDQNELRSLCKSEYKDAFLPELRNRLKLLRISAYKIALLNKNLSPGDFNSPIKVHKSMLANAVDSTIKDQVELLEPLTKDEIAYFKGESVDGKPFIYAEFLERDPTAGYFLAVDRSPMLARVREAQITSLSFSRLMENEMGAFDKKEKFTRFDFQKQLSLVVKTIKKMPKHEQKLACQIAETYRQSLESQISRAKIAGIGLTVAVGAAAAFTGQVEALPPLARVGSLILSVGRHGTYPLAAIAAFDSIRAIDANHACGKKFHDKNFESIATLCDTRDLRDQIESSQDALLWSAGGFVVFKGAGLGAKLYRIKKVSAGKTATP